jgi:hypothetical protein
MEFSKQRTQACTYSTHSSIPRFCSIQILFFTLVLSLCENLNNCVHLNYTEIIQNSDVFFVAKTQMYYLNLNNKISFMEKITIPEILGPVKFWAKALLPYAHDSSTPYPSPRFVPAQGGWPPRAHGHAAIPARCRSSPTQRPCLRTRPPPPGSISAPRAAARFLPQFGNSCCRLFVSLPAAPLN